MIERTPEGFWVISGDQWLTKWVYESKRLDHDRYAIPIACSLIVPGTVVIDVGANVGSHTVAYLDACGPDGLVVAYEPNPEPFDCLKLNCPKAMAFKCAVGEIVGHSNLMKDFPNVGSSYLFPESVDVSPESERVSITTLDHDFANVLAPIGWKTISFIKIDVEGCEPEVLKGAEKLITQYRPVVMLEINNGALQRRGNSHMDIFDFMNRHRYRAEFIPPNANWDSPQSDVIFRPL